tara:strand:+ start:1419 stop:2414 length:996 start_codon:yes stop_codon:yes gene_type:complete
MSEETMTPKSGSGDNLTVNEAVAGFESFLTPADDSNEQPEAVEQELVEDSNESEEIEYEAEDNTEAEDDDSQEEEETEEEAPQTYTVKAAGEEKEVTLDELVNGYQLGADYTKKTQELAEARKIVEAEVHSIQEARQVRDAYAQRLQALEQVLSVNEAPEDLAALRENDPIGYAVRVADATERKEQLALVYAEQQKVAQQQEQYRQQEVRKLVQLESHKLSQVLPEFSDTAKGEQLRNEIRNYGKSVGFRDEELSQVYDSRHVLTLHKAMMYDKLVKSKPGINKKVAQAPKMVKTGAKISKQGNDVVNKQKQQLRSSGHVRDAAKLFENFI